MPGCGPVAHSNQTDSLINFSVSENGRTSAGFRSGPENFVLYVGQVSDLQRAGSEFWSSQSLASDLQPKLSVEEVLHDVL